MNDNELITTVRQSVAGIHSATPVAQIISRGRAVRARRRIPALAGALAAAAGTALVVTTLLPAGHPGSHPASARLAAWTVAEQANGDLDITVHQLNDPAGLQARLRADGLPATVSFSGAPLKASCQPYPAGKDLLRAIAQFHTSHGSAYLVIHPSALPSGVGVSIFDEPGAGAPSARPRAQGSGSPPPAGITGPLAIGLVYASQQCTGG